MRSIMGHFGIMLSAAIDPDAQEIIDRITITPPIETITRINTLVLALKRAEIWNLLDSLYVPVSAPDQQAGLLDWKRSAKSATLNGSATWDQTFGFVGSTVAGSYVNTDFAPSTNGVNFIQNNASMGAYVTALPSGSTYYFGTLSGAGNSAFLLHDNGDTSYDGRLNTGTTLSTAAASAAADALIVNNRTANNNWTINKNGSTLSTESVVLSAGVSAQPCYICAYNNAGASAGSSNAKIGLWFAGAQLSLAKQASFKAAIDAYIP